MKIYKQFSNKTTELSLVDFLNSIGFRQNYKLVQVLEFKNGFDWTILVETNV